MTESVSGGRKSARSLVLQTPELLENIVSHLQRSDQVALLRVNTHFLYPAGQALYRHLEIDDNNIRNIFRGVDRPSVLGLGKSLKAHFLSGTQVVTVRDHDCSNQFDNSSVPKFRPSMLPNVKVLRLDPENWHNQRPCMGMTCGLWAINRQKTVIRNTCLYSGMGSLGFLPRGDLGDATLFLPTRVRISTDLGRAFVSATTHGYWRQDGSRVGHLKLVFHPQAESTFIRHLGFQVRYTAIPYPWVCKAYELATKDTTSVTVVGLETIRFDDRLSDVALIVNRASTAFRVFANDANMWDDDSESEGSDSDLEGDDPERTPPGSAYAAAAWALRKWKRRRMTQDTTAATRLTTRNAAKGSSSPRASLSRRRSTTNSSSATVPVLTPKHHYLQRFMENIFASNSSGRRGQLTFQSYAEYEAMASSAFEVYHDR
ncbi:uncharacterized protein LOC62_01G001586 [Vanrija pseudolonga]|uniref:Uncharacterized protein n=1 Tax=Vanrija pseudolonga TaxID=143232 RepID=A0AAF0Y0W6_9TREE|nr:hypothetical protein LOC62_01G001586 [Vanrija pseudolonga]